MDGRGQSRWSLVHLQHLYQSLIPESGGWEHREGGEGVKEEAAAAAPWVEDGTELCWDGVCVPECGWGQTKITFFQKKKILFGLS